MQRWATRDFGIALSFLGVGVIGQYIAPQFGIPFAVLLIGVGFLVIYRANKREALLTRQPLPISTEIADRRNRIRELRQVLTEFRNKMNEIEIDIGDIPLVEYEKRYLSKFPEYVALKMKYPNESDAQFVGIGRHFGLNENPLLNERLNSNDIMSLRADLTKLKSDLPDGILHRLVDTLVDTEKMRLVNSISHKLSPSRWEATISDMKQRAEVESGTDAAIRRTTHAIDTRMNQLWNGAKYE